MCIALAEWEPGQLLQKAAVQYLAELNIEILQLYFISRP